MKNSMIKNMFTVMVTIVALSVISVAEETTAATNATVNSDMVKLVNIAGHQRMLSQRIAKDYMYIGNGIAASKANRQMKASIKDFKSAHEKLKNSINDEEIKNLLEFVQLSSDEFEQTSKEEFNLDNAQLILDLSESMLEGSQYIVTALREVSNINASKIVDDSSRQLMLSQRIAKYYIAYQSGIKDENTINQMNEAVKLFSETQKELMANKTNTPEINRKLNEINKLWKIVNKFYLNIEKGGLPLIVFNTTDKIAKKMGEITELYVEMNKK